MGFTVADVTKKSSTETMGIKHQKTCGGKAQHDKKMGKGTQADQEIEYDFFSSQIEYEKKKS